MTVSIAQPGLPSKVKSAVEAVLKKHKLSPEAREVFAWNLRGFKDKPVEVERFVRDGFYLGMDEELYPAIVPDLIEMNSGAYTEVVLTGGIGSAKTTLALLTNAYQLYLLSMMENPHKMFGLNRSSEIELIFQNITASLAQSVDFARFKNMIDRSPYFTEHFPYNKTLKSELHFPNRIIVKPVSGSNLATIGQNVIGGLIDELNYMSVVEKSKRAVDAGVYDQAVEVYNSIARRRKSRYMKQGKLPGILCLVSSKKYPGQFTDQKMEEAKTDPTIYIYDKRVWDIKPDSYSKEKFRVFIGDDFRQPAILGPKEKVAKDDAHLIVTVPEDFRIDFTKDIVNALRELAGVSHLSKRPFFSDSKALIAMFSAKQKSIFSAEVVDFDQRQLSLIKSAIRNPDYPRFAHVDLALTGDSAGVAIGHVTGFTEIARGTGRDGKLVVERLPKIRIDGALEVRPPKNGEILFWRIRKIFYVLRELGVNMKWISFDTFQSADSMQLLRQKGFIVGPQSMDKTMLPYDFLKGAVYDKRITCSMHTRLFKELREVQVDVKEQKVDHLPQGSKDVADALAGVVYGLTLRREVWQMFGIPITEIPEGIIAAAKKTDAKIKGEKTTDSPAEG